RIYTVGVGAEPGALPQPDEERGGALHDPSSELDEPLLRQIAELGQGRYFRARTLHDVTAINDAINILEPSATPLVQGQPVVELYPWPLALAWLLMVLPRFASERLARAVRQGWSRWR
ncbi:VWA domain-containing protein, partial [Aeromonas cavernicola]